MISTKGRYAIRVMIDLAEHEDGNYIPLKEIAARQQISKKYLEILVKELVKGGFVVGASGKGGGYKLCRKPARHGGLPASGGKRVPQGRFLPDAPHVGGV